MNRSDSNIMFKRSLNKGDLLLIVMNLVPLFGVWFRDWDPKQMFLIYCLETAIIGFYNAIKMAVITVDRKKDIWEANGKKMMVRGWFFILFFIIHYGFFLFIQLNIFGGVSGWSDKVNNGMFGFIFGIPRLLTNDSKIVLYVFMAIYGIRMIINFIASGLYRTTSLGYQMFQPYFRIFVQQFVVIIGSILLAFGGGKIFMLVFVFFKIFFELFINYDKILEKAQQDQQRST